MSVPTFAPIPPTNSEESVEQFATGVVESQPVGTPPHVTLPEEPAAPKFTEADLARVREQEKNKLYPEIERLKQENKAFAEQEAARQQAAARAQAEAEAEAQRLREAEMSAKELILAKEQEWENRFNAQAQAIAEAEAERNRSLQLLQMEQQYQELQAYKQQALDANVDAIMPELRDLVAGNSREEIDASIQNLVERSNRIVDSVAQATQAARQQMPGARVTYPANGPLDNNSDNKQFTDEQLAAMDLATYAKNRPNLIGNGRSSQGMFG